MMKKRMNRKKDVQFANGVPINQDPNTGALNKDLTANEFALNVLTAENRKLMDQLAEQRSEATRVTLQLDYIISLEARACRAESTVMSESRNQNARLVDALIEQISLNRQLVGRVLQ